MRTEVVVVARPGRLPHIRCRGALAVRLTGPDTVHLVSTAANPIGGDTTSIRVVVEADAQLRVRTTAASIVLPGRDDPESHVRWELDVDGGLDLDPEPTVIAAHSRHFSDARVQVGGSARIRIRERVQIGRSGERAGFWSGRLRADLPGTPLLRHRIELGPGSMADDAIDRPAACISELRYPDPATDAPGTTLALAAGGSLSTWQGARL